MKRRTQILVLVASVALVACGKNNDNARVNPNNTTANNTTANNTTVNNTTANNTTVNNTTVNNTTPTNNMTTGEPATCDEYCDAVTTNCTGDNAQYPNRDACMDYCQNVGGWDAGDGGAMAGNSITCRAYHGGDPAAADPGTHCVHAGPTGGNVCGTWCENYCQLATRNCADANALYTDEAECMTACAGFADSGAAGDPEYDTVQCRIYHAGAPAAAEPALHCGHAGESPTDFCVGLPTDFNFRTNAPNEYTRVDRMGMPAVSTALITDKNAYNDGNPTDDTNLTFLGEIAASITGLHAALDDDLTGAGLTPCSMSATPSCASQPVVAGGPTVADLIVPDTLKINPANAAGFPNGRRLQDPVMDVTLAVILLDLTVHGPTALVGTNPTTNDLGVEGAFLTTFPYLHPAHQP